MKTLFATILLFGVLSSTAVAQNQTLLDGSARSASLAHAITAVENSWSSSNPASWAGITRFTAAFSAGRLFGMAELTPVSAALVAPTPVGSAGLRARSYGFEAYRQTNITAGWGNYFSFGTNRQMALGARLSYTHLRQKPPFGQSGAIGISIGTIVPLSQQFGIAAYATNLHAPAVGDNDLPREIGLGGVFNITDQAQLTGDLVKDVLHPISVRAGLQWQPVEVLSLRIGSATKPFLFSVGAGFNLDQFQVDVGGINHSDLGWSPAATLTARW